MISFFLAALLVNPLSPFNSWGYTPPDIPTLSAEQEAAFQRVFQWDAKNENELPAVLQAVKDGDLQRVKELQQQGAYIPLQHAVLWANVQGHLEIVKWLMEQGAVLPRDAYYNALSSGNLALVKWWWERPLYTRPVSKEWYEPVIVTALKSGSRELVDELLHQGNVLPTRAEIHQEILRDLVAYDREEMFIWLTQTQGWSFSPKEWGYLYDRIIVAALRTGNFQQLQRVIRMGYPLQDLSHKEVFLIYAAHNGNLQAVQWLAKQGVPVQPTKAQYYRLEYADNHKLGIEPYSLVSATNYTFVNLRPTALEEAEAHGHLDIAQWLIQQGAKPLAQLIKAEITSEHPLDKKEVALCRSVQCQVYNYQSKAAAEKIRRIPYVILDDQIGEYLSLTDSPLAIAIQAEHLPLAKYILLHYPEKIHENPGGHSFLHKAVVLHSTALVKYLLEQGADPLALDPYGRTPLDYSIDVHHQLIYNLLRNAEIKAISDKKRL